MPEYWLVNLAERVVEVFREPAAGAYRQATRHGREATLRVAGFEDVAIAVGDIVPER